MKREEAERFEVLEKKRSELEREMKEFSDRKFSLEKSKLATLGSNSKLKKR